MPKLLAVAGKLLRRAGRFVFSPCPQCCQDQADKSWLRACSCITWNPANWTVSTPCNVPQNRCVYVCLGSFLSDDGSNTIAQRLEAIRNAWFAGTPFVVKDADGRCYQVDPSSIYDDLPEGAVELGTPGSTVARATGCDDESCVAQPAGDSFVKFTPCDPTVTSGDWWGCRARLPAAGLRVIAGGCWCITPLSQTSNTITGTLLNAGIQVPDATCCACQNGRINAANQWTASVPCSAQSGGGVRCLHGDLRKVTTFGGTPTLEKRCCCGRCSTQRYTLTSFSWSVVSVQGTVTTSQTMESPVGYQSDAAGNPSSTGEYFTVVYNVRSITIDTAPPGFFDNSLATGITRTFGVGCGWNGVPNGPANPTGGANDPFPNFGLSIQSGSRSGDCQTRTWTLALTVGGPGGSTTYTGSCTVQATSDNTGCTGCGGNPSAVPGGTP